ncbi:MAG: spermidine synthase [Chitinophagales bacterium]
MAEYRANILQRLLSYFIDIKIETVYSETNSTLEVMLSRNRYQLNTLNATYSFEDLYTSYGGALAKIHPQKNKINSALVLGLGLGSIPYLLQEKYKIDCKIDCVEIDPVVIRLAKKYYPTREGFEKIKIHAADAYDWVLVNNTQFDLVTVDLFVDRNVPKKLQQKEFIEALKKSIKKNGTILFSRLKSNKELEYLLWENLFEVFPGGKDIDTMGNAIYCWKNI